MAKRCFNTEKETKALLKRWNQTVGYLPDSAGIARVNDYILRRKGLGLLVGGIAKRGCNIVSTKSQKLTNPNTGGSVLSVSDSTDFAFTAWAFYDNTSNNAYGIFTIENGGLNIRLYRYGTGGSFRVNGANAYNSSGAVSGWNFLVGYYDSATDIGSLQINNNAAVTAPTTTPWSAQGNISVGYEVNLTSYYSGGLSDASIFKRLLSTSERTYLYNSGNGRSYLEILAYQPSLLTNMVSYWPLNENGGTRYDWNGTNHLTPVNNPLGTTGVVEGLF